MRRRVAAVVVSTAVLAVVAATAAPTAGAFVRPTLNPTYAGDLSGFLVNPPPATEPTYVPPDWTKPRRGRILLDLARRPLLRSYGSGLLVLGPLAFGAGWKIGTGVNSRWLHLDGDLGVTANINTDHGTQYNEAWWAFFPAGSHTPVPLALGDYWALTIRLNGNGSTTRNSASKCVAGITEGSPGYCSPAGLAAEKTFKQWPAGQLQTLTVSENDEQYMVVIPDSEMDGGVVERTADEPYVAQPYNFESPSYAVSTDPLTEPELEDARERMTDVDREEQLGKEFDCLMEPEGYNCPDAETGEDGGPKTTVMPNCRGLSVAACEATIPVPVEITVEELTFAGADTSVAPESVVTTSPGAGVTISTGATVTVNTNPDAESMPRLIPQPLPNETYQAYITRLQGMGLVGVALEVPFGGEDPTKPPYAVLTPNPMPGTRVPVGSSVLVPYNPGWMPNPNEQPENPGPGDNPNPTTTPQPTPTRPEAPEPPNPGEEPGPSNTVPGTPEGGVGDCPCPIRPVNFKPLTDVTYGEKFPFGIFGYVADVVGLFSVAPDAPRMDFDLGDNPAGSSGDMNVGHYVVDLDVMDEWAGYVRGFISFVLWIGAVWWIATRLLGFKSAGDVGESIDEVI